MSLNSTPNTNGHPRTVDLLGSRQAPRFLLLALVFTLTAIAIDQFFAPILHSTSPLWATAACIVLVWLRGESGRFDDLANSSVISGGRLLAFFAAHLAMILAARLLTATFQPLAGTLTPGGTILAGLKLVVLVPTLLLLPLSLWKKVVDLYGAEFLAALIVLITFAPRRALGVLWPWYGQMLGHFVFSLSRLLVPGLGYIKTLTPTLSGPGLDVTIVRECSGIDGLELFEFLFSIVAVCDWNRLRKKHTLIAYFAGLLIMLLSNALRITSFVVLGNRGFAESVSRFHISAGWMFFSIVFLTYLSLTYGWMLERKSAPGVSAAR